MLETRMQQSADTRTVSLFRNGKNQAVRIPSDFELPGTKAIMRRDGDRLIIEPVRKRGLEAWLKARKPLPPEDRMPDIEDLSFGPEEDVF